MSSDGYFDGDDFDASALEQLDAIEAAHLSPSKPKAPTKQSRTSTIAISRAPPPLTKEPSFYDMSFDVDENELAKLDTLIENAYLDKSQPVAGPSKMPRTTSNNKLQTTLFGDILPPTASSSSNKPRPQLERTKSAPRNPFGQQAPKTKTWDQTAFAKTGIRKPKPKVKGKGKAGDGDDGSEEENLEFEQFPAPFVSLGPPPPMKLIPDLLEAKHWIFPINRPKRDYQFNIVKNCLFENTLVALPTGLGKTFIAGVVMMNYYRWFPEGKVIFVAPTKPLVSQQINACHETCGIPAGDSIEMNGEVAASVRARHWSNKRVFFMTPQTLVNDLVKENCDVRDIVLLVIDEAHRGSGDYAYNQAIRFLMAKNPHFRVLALTATPGNNPEAVQSLIDGLHISRIEIRDENSLDLKQYIHKKHFVPHIIKANEDLAKIRDLLVKVMDPHIKPLQKAGVFFPSDNAISLHPYRPQIAMQTLKDKKFFVSLSLLGKLARAMLYLLTGSFGACYIFLEEVSNDKPDEDAEGGKRKNTASKRLKDDPNFRALMQELNMQHARGWAVHPKVEKLKSILINHFGSKLADEPGGEVDDTKIMVFSSYRGVVDEIVTELDKERPLIRAARFIGQGTDKQGKKGLAQKEQLEVIKKFKAGEYNVLVATCIGEEGLDIGEIDITVCYDADKAPTRMIQRFGRTGRKREGTIHALLAEGREEKNIEKAESTYKEVQKVVNKGELYELYGDVERLIPDHIKPECIERVVEIEEYVREDGRKKGSPKKRAPAAGTKRKRNDDFARNIPDGASTGFVSVRDLVVKGTKKRKKVTLAKDFDARGQDDDTDEDIESGRVLAPPRRTQSAAPGPSAAGKGAPKGKLKKSATLGGSKAHKKKKVKEYTSSQFSKQGADDSDDMDIEQGVVLPSISTKGKAKSRSRTPVLALSLTSDPSPEKQVDGSIIELSDSEYSHRSSKRKDPHSRDQTPTPNDDGFIADQDMAWLVDDDEDNLDFEIVDSSPVLPKRHAPALERIQVGDDSIEISRPVLRDDVVDTSDAGEAFADDSVQFIEPSGSGARPLSRKSPLRRSPSLAHQTFSPTLLSPSKKTNTLQHNSPSAWPSSSPLYQVKAKGKATMLPPALPRRFLASPYDPSHSIPEPSYPVRPLGNLAKRRRVVFDEPESPAMELPPASQHRLRRVESTPVRGKEKRDKRKSTKPSLLARNMNPLFDGEAAHSGDEVSEGCSNSEDDVESESDRMFLKNSPATQVSRSYNQSLVYRRSLLTQAQLNGDGPAFANRPVRPKPFGRIDGARDQHEVLPSSSPPPPDDELDHYLVGSFVVDDEEEIPYEAY
ncbi:hypothetical protein GALMADRAFT_217833 [Galerina marginata CBS 339.88]|uniref:ATP-dependent DNA helicase n=1 Tax=Galerina marginata (strain CBS 339.88) TaxID=685588 RepID=A0A067TXP9_GALM3|nr:hypothetical protein GALMADRAFT_217833 [Galerina marginata CBS 339.88]